MDFEWILGRGAGGVNLGVGCKLREWNEVYENVFSKAFFSGDKNKSTQAGQEVERPKMSALRAAADGHTVSNAPDLF